MTRKLTNMVDIKKNNRALILRAINDGNISRKDIAKHIHLTPAAVTILVNEMITEGIIIETGILETTSRVGRKKSFVRINESFKFILGVNVESDSLTVSLSNLYRDILETISTPIQKRDSSKLITMICDQCNFFINKYHLKNSQLLGVGIGIVGNVDSIHGISKKAYGIWNEEVDIKSIIEKRLGLRVVVDNNVRALALAETEQHKASSNLVFIKYGPGIGASLILDNDIYTGFTFNAMELGHFIVDIHGTQCLCGQKGCLETIGSYTTIYQKVISEFKNKQTPYLSNLCENKIESVNLHTICNAYGEDLIIQDIINRAIEYFAIGLINLIKAMDTESIVLYGEFFQQDTMFTILKKAIDDLGCISSDRITRSTLIETKSIGAITLARKKLFFDTGANKKG